MSSTSTIPPNPKQINFIRTANDSHPGEGIHAIPISTGAFTGDVLAFNNESCLNQAGKTSQHAIGGFTLVDVTNPKTHKFLVEGFGDHTTPGLPDSATAHEIHSVFIWEDDQGTPADHSDDRAYAVSVDNEENIDVDVFDITDPRNPFMVFEYEADTRFPQIIQADLGPNSSFLHDIVVKNIGGSYVMLLSNWDGGYVTVNVDDPSNPTYIGDTDFTNPDPEAAESGLVVPPEGNAHEAEFSLNDNFIVAADEDFDAYAVTATTDDGTIIENASPGSDTPPLEQGDTISGRAVYVGRACPGDPAVPAADGDEDQIAIVERGVCTFTEKIAAVDAAGGYEAAIVFNRTAPDGCNNVIGMTVAGTTPTFGVVPRQTGYSFFDAEASYNQAECEAGDGTQLAPFTIDQEGDVITLASIFDGWGYVHLYQNGVGKLLELDTYAIPEAHNEAYATGFGDLSVHEVAMSHERNDPPTSRITPAASGSPRSRAMSSWRSPTSSTRAATTSGACRSGSMRALSTSSRRTATSACRSSSTARSRGFRSKLIESRCPPGRRLSSPPTAETLRSMHLVSIDEGELRLDRCERLVGPQQRRQVDAEHREVCARPDGGDPRPRRRRRRRASVYADTASTTDMASLAWIERESSVSTALRGAEVSVDSFAGFARGRTLVAQRFASGTYESPPL